MLLVRTRGVHCTPRVWLYGIEVPQKFGGGCRGHLCGQHGVSKSVTLDTFHQFVEVIPSRQEGAVPHVVLQYASLGMRSCEEWVWTIPLGKVAARLVRSVIDAFEYLAIELSRRRGFKGHGRGHENVREALRSDSYGSGIESGSSGTLRRVVVAINEIVGGEYGETGDAVQLFEVERHPGADEARERDGRQGTDGGVFGRRVLYDFGA